MWMTDLLEIAHHCILVAFEYAAEELYDLLVIEVVDAFYDAWQEQLHGQIKISVELIWDEGKDDFRQTSSRRNPRLPQKKPTNTKKLIKKTKQINTPTST